MNSKKRCFICKDYGNTKELVKTNIGYAHKTCIASRKRTQVQLSPKRQGKPQSQGKVAKKQLKSSFKSMKKEADQLWSEIVKMRAGYKSELSGKPGIQIGGDSILNSHHCGGKSSLALRYNLDGGICITKGEHFFGIHHQARRDSYQERIEQVKGKEIMDRLRQLKASKSSSLISYLLFLRAEKETILRNASRTSSA